MKEIKAQLIYNPKAGQRNRRKELYSVIGYLAERGWLVRWRETQAIGDATLLAREAVEDRYDAAIVVGGDGTINEAVNGLVGSDVALGILPAGIANVWALEMGIPIRTHMMAATEILASGKTCWVDLGQAGDRYFILAAGVGFDGLVAEKIANSKRRLGKLSYILTALSLISSYRGTQATITIDGETINEQVLWILLGNLQLYGGVLRIATQARLEDGLLDVVIFKGRSLFSSLPCFAYILTQGRCKVPEVDYYQGREIEVRATSPLPVHVDAEFVGNTPLVFRAVPRSLRVIVPTELPPALFDDPCAREPIAPGGET